MSILAIANQLDGRRVTKIVFSKEGEIHVLGGDIDVLFHLKELIPKDHKLAAESVAIYAGEKIIVVRTIKKKLWMTVINSAVLPEIEKNTIVDREI